MEGDPVNRSEELDAIRATCVQEFDAAHAAREIGLSSSREVIRACSRSIRMVHRQEFDAASSVADEAEASLRRAQNALESFPKVRFAGFLHDAEKEYVEARATAALVKGEPLPLAGELGVDTAAWLNGLAEAASELRRYLLDQLRSGSFESCDALLSDMDDIYELLVGVDYPEAITGGLRRTTDAFRAVLERTRSDYTTAVLQVQLRDAIEAHPFASRNKT